MECYFGKDKFLRVSGRFSFIFLRNELMKLSMARIMTKGIWL